MNAILQADSQICNNYKQLDLFSEPLRLYKNVSNQAKFALCHKTSSGKVHQELYPFEKLGWVTGQIGKLKNLELNHFWISQATLKPQATNRRVSSIMYLNAVWCDIDLLHPPKNFAAKVPEGRSMEALAALLVIHLQDAGLPIPSFIVATGGGLCPKWVFKQPLPAVARARWQSLQTYIVQKIGEIQGEFGSRWPVDYSACDAARILRLVGTFNPRWGTQCTIAWDSGITYDFDSLADGVLPYTRAEVRDFRAEQSQWKSWDKNRAKAANEGMYTPKLVGLSDEAARQLWCERLEFGKALIEMRGGVKEGSRNNYFWPLANALAYSCTSAEQLMQEISALHHGYFKHDGWTRGEAISSASSVLARIKAKRELFKMKNSTFIEKLDVTSSELKALKKEGLLSEGSGHNAKRDEWVIGVMGFEPMKGLEFDAYFAEARRRQGEAGVRTAAGRAAQSSEKRAKAVLMKNSGASTRQIAAEIGISQKTASRWTQSE